MNRQYIEVLDMTSMFNKELLLYSISDMRFKRPVRIMFILYSFALMLIWTLPLTLLLFPFNVYTAVLAFAPPIALGNLMSKPIWGGKPFSHWIKAQLQFITKPKFYYDTVARKNINEQFQINNYYVVSRISDYRKLNQYIKDEKRNKGGS